MKIKFNRKEISNNLSKKETITNISFVSKQLTLIPHHASVLVISITSDRDRTHSQL